MPGFDHFPPAALRFLIELSAQNTKAWFTANKPSYQSEVKASTEAFAAEMALALEAATGLPHRAKVFRIYRDVRFSKDKTPYHTYIRCSFTPEGPDPAPALFFGMDPKGAAIGGGVFGYEKAALQSWRDRMAGPDGATLKEILAELEAKGFRVPAPEMKTVPRGFPKDHPQADQLRRKGATGWQDLPSPEVACTPGFAERFLATCAQIQPLIRFLRAAA